MINLSKISCISGEGHMHATGKNVSLFHELGKDVSYFLDGTVRNFDKTVTFSVYRGHGYGRVVLFTPANSDTTLSLYLENGILIADEAYSEPSHRLLMKWKRETFIRDRTVDYLVYTNKTVRLAYEYIHESSLCVPISDQTLTKLIDSYCSIDKIDLEAVSRMTFEFDTEKRDIYVKVDTSVGWSLWHVSVKDDGELSIVDVSAEGHLNDEGRVAVGHMNIRFISHISNVPKRDLDEEKEIIDTSIEADNNSHHSDTLDSSEPNSELHSQWIPAVNQYVFITGKKDLHYISDMYISSLGDIIYSLDVADSCRKIRLGERVWAKGEWIRQPVTVNCYANELRPLALSTVVNWIPQKNQYVRLLTPGPDAIYQIDDWDQYDGRFVLVRVGDSESKEVEVLPEEIDPLVACN